MRATRLNRKIAASRERKNKRAPAKKKLPVTGSGSESILLPLVDDNDGPSVASACPGARTGTTGHQVTQILALHHQIPRHLHILWSAVGDSERSTDRAVAEVEAFGGMALDLGVEVDEKGADGVLVRL